MKSGGSRGCVAMLGLALAAPAFGLDPRLSLQQYLHTKWSQSEGKPLPIVDALAQTADGYLWLGTSRGMLKFDGVRFSKPDLPKGVSEETVRTLAPSGDGGLWIGTERGLARLDPRHPAALRWFELPSASVNAALEDRLGNLWYGAAPDKRPIFTVFDTKRRLALSAQGPNVPAEVVSLAQDRNGVVWADSAGDVYACTIADGKYQCRLSRPPSSNLLAPVTKAVLHDADGNFWIGTLGQGLFCFRGGRVERFTERDGLSSDAVLALLEDRQGNIWAATTNGIDRFREPRMARWSTAQGLNGNFVTTVRRMHNGDLWVASVGGLDRLRDGRISHIAPAAGSPHIDVLTLFEDSRHVLWAGTTMGFGYFNGPGFVEVPAADGSRYYHVLALAEDRNGAIWLADGVRGLASVRNGKVDSSMPGGLPAAAIHQLGTDHDGNLWVGYVGGGVAIIDGKNIRSASAREGLAAGSVQAFFEDTTGSMWVGTTEGMSRYRDRKWTTWTAANGIPAGGVQAFSEDTAGSLWLVTRSGLAPVKRQALDELPDVRTQKPHPLSLVFYGPNDGIRMPENGNLSNSRVATSPDGRIWLATPDGLAVIDPHTIRGSRVPPPVVIEQLRLPPDSTPSSIRGRPVEIEYTALSLTLPETVRFRYRLEPVESEWVDAGTRREIAYAALAPGKYHFRVTARDEDGAWNPNAADLTFTVAPEFYQTWYFWSSCACLLALGAYTLHKARIRGLRKRFQIVLQERTRLSRELHDTLLQGFAGVVFQLEAATRQLETQPEAGRRRLAQALEQADRSLREARQALSCMRLTDLENRTLAEAVRRAGERMVDGSAIDFQMEVTGRSRELPYDIQANLFVIAREAMNNAVSHGRPEHITVNVDYRDRAVALAVTDNGRGFKLDNGRRKPDHWGLAGMQERARHMGADFAIHTAPGMGTTVQVIVTKLPRRLIG